MKSNDLLEDNGKFDVLSKFSKHSGPKKVLIEKALGYNLRHI